MTAGNNVRALDVMPSAQQLDATLQANVTSTSFIPWVPAVFTTFIAPTSGTVLVVVGGGIRSDSGTNRGAMAFEMREYDVNGTVIVSPGNADNAFTNGSVSTTLYQYGSRMVPVRGLVPGRPYFTQIMIAVTGGSVTDIFNTQLFIIPSAS